MTILTAIVFIPVSAVTVAEPPRISIEETMMFVARPKNINTRWAAVPQRAATISSHVWACGALSLSFAASYMHEHILNDLLLGVGANRTHLSKKQNLHCCTRAVPPWTGNPILVRHCARLQLWCAGGSGDNIASRQRLSVIESGARCGGGGAR